MDVATCRAETYDAPGALPRVRPAAIEEDLARRDFTVNALALTLTPGRPRLLDPFGGVSDLARRRLRMLSSRSPFDDPTRAFRAVRYGNRLGFRIAPATRRAIRSALAAGAFRAVSADRIRRELALLLGEPRPARAVAELARLGLDAVIHPKLSADSAARRRLRRSERLAASEPRAGWLAHLLAWASALDATAAEELASRLNLARPARKMVGRWPERWRELARGSVAGRPAPVADELVAAAAAAGATMPRRPPTSLAIRGADLVRAGVSPGPRVGRALAATQEARSQGRISEAQELAFALAVAAEP